MMASRFTNTPGKPVMSPICSMIGSAASMPTFASRPGCRNSVSEIVEPEAISPSPANERKTMPASRLKLLRM